MRRCAATKAQAKAPGASDAHPSGDHRFKMLDATMKRLKFQPDALIVTKTGNGNVDSSDKLVSCGSKCAQPYDAGRVVSLTAKAGSGSVFLGWSGACGGLGNTCTVTVNGAVNVGAGVSGGSRQLTSSAAR